MLDDYMIHDDFQSVFFYLTLVFFFILIFLICDCFTNFTPKIPASTIHDNDSRFKITIHDSRFTIRDTISEYRVDLRYMTISSWRAMNDDADCVALHTTTLQAERVKLRESIGGQKKQRRDSTLRHDT